MSMDQFDRFQQQVRERMEMGRKEYGDRSFDAQGLELVEEIRQELLDVCGWSYILWHKLGRVEQAIKPLEQDAGQLEQAYMAGSEAGCEAVHAAAVDSADCADSAKGGR